MKRYVYSRSAERLELNLAEIESITLVADAFDFSPRDFTDSISITSAKQLRKNYYSMTREQLLSLPKKELASIKDVDVLRKLDFSDLDPAQQVLVGQANRNYRDKLTKSKVNKILEKLKACNSFFIWPTKKNNSFMKEIQNLGGQIELSDVRNIVHSLTIGNFSDSTLSYLDVNWNNVLMIFKYSGDYTFKSIDGSEQGVTVSSLEIYIKLDVDNVDGRGIGAVSFHKPEYKMSLPYKNK